MTEAELKSLNSLHETIRRLKAIQSALSLGSSAQVHGPDGWLTLPLSLDQDFQEWIAEKLDEAEEQFQKA